jgi:hypothetical protein
VNVARRPEVPSLSGILRLPEPDCTQTGRRAEPLRANRGYSLTGGFLIECLTVNGGFLIEYLTVYKIVDMLVFWLTAFK